MTLGSSAKAWLNGIGALLGLAGLVFVGFKLRAYASDLDAKAVDLTGYAIIAGLAVAYGASNLLLASGWYKLLEYCDVEVSRRWALRTYAVSQLAKYVPGNIFQFAGRQVIGVAAGIANKPLAKSTALELGCLIVGGALFFPLVAPIIFDVAAPAGLGLAAFAVLTAAALWIANRIGGLALSAAAISYLLFLIVSGALFFCAMEVAGARVALTMAPTVIGAYVIAWLAGLVTPGAPAGLGIREAVLLFLLGNLAAAPIILLAVLMGRAITVLGDLGFYIAGSLSRDAGSGRG